MTQKITGKITKKVAQSLTAGDEVLYTGTMYTARDAAHKRLVALIDEGGELPFDLQDAMIYYVGPSPTKPNQIIGSAGPTTSYRMDPYTPKLLDHGLTSMVGKGVRSPEVVASIIEHGAVYFATIGGAAALIARSVVTCEEICYPDLGAESIKRLEVVDFPMTVVVDAKGNDLYKLSGDQSQISE
ncbi:MAG: Fe-S-containing hydro-lyase [Eubacteriales bacterium]